MLHGIRRCSPLSVIIHIGIETMPLGLSVGEGEVIEEPPEPPAAEPTPPPPLPPVWSSLVPAGEVGVPDPTSEQGIRRCTPFIETKHIGIDTVGTCRPRRRPPCTSARLGAAASPCVASPAFAPAPANRAAQTSITTTRSCVMLGDASFPLLALQRAGILFSSLSREKKGGFPHTRKLNRFWPLEASSFWLT